MSQEIPTPRTDLAATNRLTTGAINGHVFQTYEVVVPVDFARQLERELTAAQQDARMLDANLIPASKRIRKLTEENAELRAKCERLEADLLTLQQWVGRNAKDILASMEAQAASEKGATNEAELHAPDQPRDFNECQPMKPKKPDLLTLVRAKQEISIRELAKRLRKSHRATLDECEDIGLNINIGFRIGNGVGEFSCIGDYTIEDLSVPANYSAK